MNKGSPLHDYSSRIARVQKDLSQDASLLVTDALNIRYLCGFSGSSGALVIDRESATLVTDGRYVEQAHSETFSILIFESRSLFDGVGKVIKTGQVFFEPNNLTITQYERLSGTLSGRTLIKSSINIESIRVIKDNSEIALIEQACAISTTSLHELVSSGLLGLSEKAIAQRLNALMIKHGADGPAFDSIVATGPNSAIPHHQPTDRPFTHGDLLKIDFGALVLGYHADCTRTFSAGEPTAWQRETYDAVYTSQTAATAMVAAGVALTSVDQCARGVIASLGRTAEFVHGLGHGVGLQIHEDPFLSATDATRLEENMVITVEPGLYVPGLGGVRIEDTLVVTASGSKNLTVFPYELINIS